MEDFDNHLIEQNAAAETTFQEKKRAAEDSYDHLRIRISEAWKSSKTQAITRIEEEEGRRKYRLQTATMQAARVRKDGIAATEKEYEQFCATLQAEDQTLLPVEAAIRSSFRGIWKFRKMLEAPAGALDQSKDEYQLLGQLRQLRTQCETDLQKYNHILLPKFFKFLPWWHADNIVRSGKPCISDFGFRSLLPSQEDFFFLLWCPTMILPIIFVSLTIY